MYHKFIKKKYVVTRTYNKSSNNWWHPATPNSDERERPCRGRAFLECQAIELFFFSFSASVAAVGAMNSFPRQKFGQIWWCFFKFFFCCRQINTLPPDTHTRSEKWMNEWGVGVLLWIVKSSHCWKAKGQKAMDGICLAWIDERTMEPWMMGNVVILTPQPSPLNSYVQRGEGGEKAHPPPPKHRPICNMYNVYTRKNSSLH